MTNHTVIPDDNDVAELTDSLLTETLWFTEVESNELHLRYCNWVVLVSNL